MTTEEVIKYLKQFYVVPAFTWLDEKRNQALDIAIEKLKEKL